MMHVCILCSRCATMLCATAAVESWWCITVHLHLIFVIISIPIAITTAARASDTVTTAILADLVDYWYILAAY